MSVTTDMNDVRAINSDEEKFFFYLKHCATLHNEYWDMMPMGGKIKEHPWDNLDE